MPTRVEPGGSPASWSDRIGRIGIWSAELRFGDRAKACAAARELDQLGFGAVWVPGGVGGDILGAMSDLLDATDRITVASAIINVWKHEPAEIGAWWREQGEARQGRLLLGLGVSHAPLIGASYAKPIAVMSRYIEALTAQGVPRDRLCVAAFGPRMLALAGDQSAGAHPYLSTAEHTAAARAQLGPSALLAPGQWVAFESDPNRARAAIRGALSVYVHLPNYQASWKRQGFTERDIAEVSDRLCDAMAAWGGVDRMVAGVKAHLDAGADHVCVKVVRGAPGGDATELLPEWRELAAALL